MRVFSFGSVGRALGGLLATSILAAAMAQPAAAQTIIDEWSTVEPPPPPNIEPQQVDAKTGAVLVLDFINQICNARVPRCIASVPKVAKLIAAARAAGALVVYSKGTGAKDTDILTALTPVAGDPIVASGPDKFIGTNLAQILHDRGIATVIVTGVAANGAVMDTATDAALHGMNVVIPVDGMSAGNPYVEQYVAYDMVKAPGMAKVKLATIDGITFK